MTYPLEELWDEMAYLAFHLHWDLERILDLEHADRRVLLERVASLNEKAWAEVANLG